jgi:hypothetical protein
MSGQTWRELAQEFKAFRGPQAKIEKPVHYAALSAAKGEKLSIEKSLHRQTHHARRESGKAHPGASLVNRAKYGRNWRD